MLLDQIRKDQTKAQKQGEKIELSTLRLLSAKIHNLEIDKKAPLADEEIIKVIQSQIKKRHEAIRLYRKGKREELAQREEEEAKVLSKYLPQQMDPEEVTQLARKIVEDLGGKHKANFGQVMGQLTKQIAGRAPGDLAASQVKKLLS